MLSIAMLAATPALAACSNDEVPAEVIAAAAAAPAAAADDAAADQVPPADVFCANLDDGQEPRDAWFTLRDSRSLSEMATLSLEWASTTCPEELETNDVLRQYLLDWNLDLDG